MDNLKKLGLAPAKRVTKKVLKERVTKLERMISSLEKSKTRGAVRLLELAKYYRRHFRYHLENGKAS